MIRPRWTGAPHSASPTAVARPSSSGPTPSCRPSRRKDALEKADFTFRQAQADFAAAPKQTQFDVSSKKSLFDRQQLVVTDLRRQVNALQVQSPVDGRVGQVQVAERASVAKDAPLLTVIDLSLLEVEIKVPESLARDLQPGMGATLEGDGRQWQATLSGVSPGSGGGRSDGATALHRRRAGWSATEPAAGGPDPDR